ncbi:MAG: 2-oxo acid dehydrogenase subunit E2, partial [Bdellovibrionaceae bacterium]|nr:2-oxo acid dehydrogenase subunit E2 [Pseudobdellovibrionaceae bacterium]
MAIKKITLPDLGEGITEGEILKIKVKEKDSIDLDQVLLEVMTDKASMEVPSSIKGIIEKVYVKEGDIVSVGAELFSVESKESENEKEKRKEKTVLKESASFLKEKKSDKKIKSETDLISQDRNLAIPSSRKLAKELDIDLKELKGSGDKGEIFREDLLNYIKQKMKSPSHPSPSLIDFEESKRVPVKGIQRLMFESMSLSKATIPHFTIIEQAKVEHLISLRAEMKARLEKQGLKIGYLPFFIKALIPTLKEFPL